VRSLGAAVLAVAIAGGLPAGGARAGDVASKCIDGSAEEAVAAGTDEGGAAPPPFSAAFFRQTFTLDVSTDGLAKNDLTLSIEAVCDVPPAYAGQAVQLAGADGVAVISPSTRVVQDKHRLKGAARRAALDGADTMRLTVRLASKRHWRSGEDDPVPTFVTRRADITD
jgi:hypothetical protein